MSLRHRLLVVAASLVVFAYGSWLGWQAPIDVFPDLNRPRVTIMTEAHGLAPEEVETLVTIPLESALNGTPGVLNIRSSSGVGLSIVHVDFQWGTEVYRNRQLIAERLQLARERLPDDSQPIMAPVSSIMGEIQFVGLKSTNTEYTPWELREIADWVIRPRLMSIPGVSQVIVMGGGVKEYQIRISVQKLQAKGIPLEELSAVLSDISQNTTGGFLNKDGKEFLIRPIARAVSLDDLRQTPVGTHFGNPVLLHEVAEVKIGEKEKRGTARINAEPAIVFTIQKQPQGDTIKLTEQIDEAAASLQKSLPPGLVLDTGLFKQATFIDNAIDNVMEALRDGSIMVAIILFLFLLNFRTTMITLVAIPLSFAVTLIIFHLVGLGINTMTLGGLAIAIGELVDDAIVDVENVFRRLRENRQKTDPRPILTVVYEASKEIRSSVVISTIIVVAVFVPLFALSGLEGRLFTPMGISYIVSLTASLIVSLSLTPVLCYFLLPQAKAVSREEPFISRSLKAGGGRLIAASIRIPGLLALICLVLLAGSLVLLARMDSNFLPQFNEGTATIGVASYPGISLPESDQLGARIDKAILSVPEVKSTVRRTGRAIMDEHAEGVHWSEIDVDFHAPVERPMQKILADIRERILAVDDVAVNLGQPIGHRIDHMMSGVRAQIAIKIFGPDSVELRRLAVMVENVLTSTTGLVDIQIEPLVKVPQIHIRVDRGLAAEFGIASGPLAESLEMALRGEEVATFIDQQRIFDITVRMDEQSRSKIEQLESILVKIMPNGRRVYLSDIAYVYETMGPNMINRENLQRRLIVSANSPERALSDVVEELQTKVAQAVDLPEGYFIEFGGQYQSQMEATRQMILLASLSLAFIFVVLYSHFKSAWLAAQILLNVPLALIGSVCAIWLTGLDLSLATTVAFITLCGIASRNGVLMIDRYLSLIRENKGLSRDLIIRGTQDRLLPIIMTAGTAVLALTPLLVAEGEPGKEILHPVAVVIVGGLISSTILNTFLTPALFAVIGPRIVNKVLSQGKTINLQEERKES
jgi:Cu(I)/Ag(I) efflux system membrane protein CusA/SilA